MKIGACEKWVDTTIDLIAGRTHVLTAQGT